MTAASVTRRGLLALAGLVGVAGCAEAPAAVIAKDPNLQLLVQDPMYLWNPAGDLTRIERLEPRSDSKLASGSNASHITVEFQFRGTGDTAALVAEAEQAMSTAGYVGSLRTVFTDVSSLQVMCVASPLRDGNGIYVRLTAPA